MTPRDPVSSHGIRAAHGLQHLVSVAARDSGRPANHTGFDMLPHRARPVAATEGLQVLAAKVLRRLRTTPLIVRDRVERIHADGIAGAQAFRTARPPVRRGRQDRECDGRQCTSLRCVFRERYQPSASQVGAAK
jgi:hypothetical protein